MKATIIIEADLEEDFYKSPEDFLFEVSNVIIDVEGMDKCTVNLMPEEDE